MAISLPSVAKLMENMIVIGKVGAPHGVRGEVRIIPLTDFPDRFDSLEKAYLEEEEITITSVKHNKQFVILKFKDMDDREAVAARNGQLLKVKRSEVAPLAEGEYYGFDIIGLEVYDEQSGHIGQVIEILKTGSNDVYVVGSKGQAQQILVPALKTVVTSIDLDAGKMTVALPEVDE